MGSTYGGKGNAAMRHPLTAYPRGTLWHILHHYFDAPPTDLPDLHMEPSSVSVPQDDLIAERLINVFHKMLDFESRNIPPPQRPNEGIWEMSRHAFHGEAYSLILGRDVKGFARYMANCARTKLCHGLGPGLQVYKAFSGEVGTDSAAANRLILWDRLVALAEAIALLPHENSEQGRYGTNFYLPFDSLIDGIQSRLGCEIFRPTIMGLFGFKYKKWVIDVRVPDDAYGGYRLGVEMERTGGRRVAEIGGGLGGMALQAGRAGAASYAIFDLPIMNLVQGYFLIKILGGDKVALFGEPADRRYRLLPYWEFRNRDNVFDIVFNRDSLPEIPRARAEEYLSEIDHRRCLFLSINQESGGGTGRPGTAQLNTAQMMDRYAGMKRRFRAPYWIRRGYVEELYSPD